MYNLYNSLAARSVIKVGGKPLFKASVKKSLLSEDGKREILLMVRYPDGHAFKKMMETTYFKLVSLLRIKAVKRFTFSFTKPYVDKGFDPAHDHYALHYFEGGDPTSLLKAMKNAIVGVEVLFVGKSFAHLYRREDGKEDEVVKSMVECIIIYGSDSEERMADFLTSEEYLRFFNPEDRGYIASLNKIF